MRPEEIAEKIIAESYEISFGEAVRLTDYPDTEELYAAADRIRRHFCGDALDTCYIVNARSGKCPEDCKWCAQSARHSTGIPEYPAADTNSVVRVAEENDKHGVNRFSLVTSGRKVDKKEMEKFCGMYREVANRTGMKMCASMGLLGREELLMLKEVGVRRYECNLETSSSFFSALCTTHTIEQKKETLRLAKEVGMEICSGGIIGMGESMEQRIEMAFELKELGVSSVPVNVLNPIPGTALASRPPLSAREILTTISVFRFILPRAAIRFAGGRIRMPRELQLKALRCGLNASLVGGLLTTPGTEIKDDYKLFREAGYMVGGQV